MKKNKRQVVLDTETTGIDPRQGHRIVEIGCVELVNRRLTGRHYHQYVCPDRRVDPEAVAVHGITDEFLMDKPRFTEIVDDFVTFVEGAELVIHNAPFDVGFLDAELSWLRPARPSITNHCGVLDTLKMAREMFPGQRASLDALCKRYGIDNGHRTLHGALLDAEILADVYLFMTGGQTDLMLAEEVVHSGDGEQAKAIIDPRIAEKLLVQRATAEEIAAHEEYLTMVDKQSDGATRWRVLQGGE